jgi:hypothetical protein
VWHLPFVPAPLVLPVDVALCGQARSSTYVDDVSASAYRGKVDIEASARKHGVHDDDMLHAYRHHLIAFATNDGSVTMFVGPVTVRRAAGGWCGRR